GDRRVPAGIRVRTEYVSNHAWPARPRSDRSAMSSTAAWSSWSWTTSGTAALLSNRWSRRSSPVGIPKLQHHRVGDRDASGRDDEDAFPLLHEPVSHDRLDADRRTVELNVHLRRTHQPSTFA